MKYVIYATNLAGEPANMNEVVTLAQEGHNFRISEVHGGRLAATHRGDRIITKAGNILFVIKAPFTMDGEAEVYANGLVQLHDMRPAQIGAIKTVTSLSVWSDGSDVDDAVAACDDDGFMGRMMSVMRPERAKAIRYSLDGNLCVETADGFIAIDDGNNLLSYPKEATIAIPAFIVCKPIDQLACGDIVCHGKSFIKVTGVDGNNIKGINYNGNGAKVHTVKDVVFNQNLVRVVLSLCGTINGSINPMMALLIGKGDGIDDGVSSILPLLMMQQNGTSLAANPLMTMMLLGSKGIGAKEMMLMSMLGGNNPLAGMFGGCACAKATPVASHADATVEDPDGEIVG